MTSAEQCPYGQDEPTTAITQPIEQMPSIAQHLLDNSTDANDVLRDYQTQLQELYNRYEVIKEAYATLAEATENPEMQRFAKSRNILNDTATSFITEPNLDLLDLIMSSQMALVTSDLPPMEPHEIADFLRENVSVLERFFSIKRGAMRSTRPIILGEPGRTEVYDIDGYSLSKEDCIVSVKDGALVPRLSSLRDNEWRVPGNCIARWPLANPDPRITESVGAFLAQRGEQLTSTNRYRIGTIALHLALDSARHDFCGTRRYTYSTQTRHEVPPCIMATG